MEDMAAMLTNVADGLQQSFGSVFERMGESLTQSAQMMQMMNDMMEAALLQNLQIQSSYADALLQVTLSNHSQLLLRQISVSLRLQGDAAADGAFASACVETLESNQHITLAFALPASAASSSSGVIEVGIRSPGTQAMLHKHSEFFVSRFQRGSFEPALKSHETQRSVRATTTASISLQRVRELLQLSPFDAMMTDETGFYRFRLQLEEEQSAVVCLSVDGAARAQEPRVSVWTQCETNDEASEAALEQQCQQLVRELEELCSRE